MSFAHDQMPLTAEAATGPSRAEVRDFVTLLKPRVMSLVVFSALVGMVLAPADLAGEGAEPDPEFVFAVSEGALGGLIP